MADKPNVLKNIYILTIALWKAGGDTEFVDIEDAYAICWEMAPQRFAWRTRKDLPALDILSAVFRSLASSTDFVLKDGPHNVRLSATGLQWIEQNGSVISAFTGTESEKIEFSSTQASRQMDRFKKTSLFRKWQADSEMNPEKWELALALRCSSNSPSSVWLQRIETLRADSQLFNDSEVLRFTDQILNKEPAWFREN